MAVSVSHATTTAQPNDPTKDVSATAWNEAHTVTGLGTAAESAATDFATASHNHAGVYQPLATVLTNTTASFTTAQETKLSGIATAAQVNADITKAEIEAKLTGVISSHSHSGGGSATGVFSDLQMSILQSDGTLNAASGVQTWAGTNNTAQDVFTVTANTTYRVRGQWIVNTGATTHTTAMAFDLATATVTDFQYLVILWSAAANTLTTTQSTCHVTGVASKVLNATSTAVYTIISFEGILVIGTGGTITPQINFSANPTGTNLMKRGSWTSFEKLGADTVTVLGGWA